MTHYEAKELLKEVYKMTALNRVKKIANATKSKLNKSKKNRK
jgi:hypothetical protein